MKLKRKNSLMIRNVGTNNHKKLMFVNFVLDVNNFLSATGCH